MRDEHIEAMYNAATDLIHTGNCSPHKQEIAVAYFGETAATITTVVDEVAIRLPKLRKMFVQDGFACVLVAYPFYTEFDRILPATMADAARCLAIGSSKRSVGLHIVVDAENDLLWHRDLEQQLKSAFGKTAKVAQRTASQVNQDKLTIETARILIQQSASSLDDRYAAVLARPLVRELAKP